MSVNLHGLHASATRLNRYDLLRFCLLFQVIAGNSFDFALGAQYHADSLMQLSGLKV
jgi:hypothetical protein